jgi:hypothetical protein
MIPLTGGKLCGLRDNRTATFCHLAENWLMLAFILFESKKLFKLVLEGLRIRFWLWLS